MPCAHKIPGLNEAEQTDVACQHMKPGWDLAWRMQDNSARQWSRARIPGSDALYLRSTIYLLSRLTIAGNQRVMESIKLLTGERGLMERLWNTRDLPEKVGSYQSRSALAMSFALLEDSIFSALFACQTPRCLSFL